MEEETTRRSALHCPICKKLYTDGIDSRARSKHVSYCRKRHQSEALPRRKACDECVRSKVRCSLGLKGCTRCASRGVLCTYQGTLNGQNVSRTATETDGGGLVRMGPLQVTGVPTVDTPSQSSQDFTTGLSSLSVEPEEILLNSNLSSAEFAWKSDNFIPDWSHLSNLTTGLAEEDPLGPYVNASSTSGALQYSSNIDTLPGQSVRPSPLTLASLDFRDSSLLFERRKFSEPELELTADLALHILRSYPHMMINQDSVPPFIHPKYQYLSEDKNTNPSPLDAALKLSKTMLQGRRMNKSLIWGLIRIEQERLLNEYHKFDRWEVLEALQSLVVYILLRIIEGRHDYTNFDTKLLATVNAICQHITRTFGTLISSDELMGHMIMWKDWVFFESRRRTATAVLIINGILHAQITTPSWAMPEYSSSPAPSPLKLWHADTELDWAVDYAEYLHGNAMHGMLRNSDLTELKESSGKQHNRWYAYADSFGLLVTLAANMIN